MMIDCESEAGAYAEAYRFPPFAGAMTESGEFRRGFPETFECGERRPDAGSPADPPFHGQGDSRG